MFGNNFSPQVNFGQFLLLGSNGSHFGLLFDISKPFLDTSKISIKEEILPMSLYEDFEPLYSLIFFHSSRYRDRISPLMFWQENFTILFQHKHFDLAIYAAKWLQIWSLSCAICILQDRMVDISYITLIYIYGISKEMMFFH